jgi:2-desacetyl-2-hydroxyethyl bacteriochlorophyllide A dehydrogenase
MSIEAAGKAYRNPAVVFSAPSVVEIEDRGNLVPEPGEVIIRNRLSMISTGTELTLLEAKESSESAWGKITRFPETPGYCSVGDVVAVGNSSDEHLIGRRVTTSEWASHARFMRAGADNLRFVGDDVPDEQAVFASLAEIVMNGVRRAGIGLGETVVVYGLGLLGQLAARLCRLSGAGAVVGVDVAASRLDCFPSAPGYYRVDGRSDVETAVRDLTRGRMADVVFEVTGAANLIPSQFSVLREQGRFVVLSSPRGATAFDFHDFCNRTSTTIIGAHINSSPAVATPDNPWTRCRNAEVFFDMVARGDIDVRPLISHHAPWWQAAELYQSLLRDRGSAMGVILDWQVTHEE